MHSLSAPESPGEAAPGGEAEPAALPGEAPAAEGEGEPGPGGGAEAAGQSEGAAEEHDPEAAPVKPSQNIAVQVGAGRGSACCGRGEGEAPGVGDITWGWW